MRYLDRLNFKIMSRQCELTGVGPRKGSHIWRSGKAKKKGGIGTHITAITKRRFLPNLQATSVLSDALGGVRLRLSARAIRTIEHKGGLDAFLLAQSPGKLSAEAARLRRRIDKRKRPGWPPGGSRPHDNDRSR